jgi:hypothetical protein
MSDLMHLEQARDWSFEKLVREGLSLIPAYAKDWTNHNASDPGITLLELLAYIAEILIYRALRVTPDAKFNFLQLLGAPQHVTLDDLAGKPAHVIEDAICARIGEMREAVAVTPADFEALTGRTVRHHLGVKRFGVKCLPGVDVRRVTDANARPAIESPGDISVLLALDGAADPEAKADLLHEVQRELQQHCLLTTRAHVAQAIELHVAIACRIAPKPGVGLAEAIAAVDAALADRFDPLRPETLSNTGPFGRTLHLGSVAGVIDRTDGVDYVDDVAIQRMAVTQDGREEEGSVGIRIGMTALVGENTRLGGRASIPLRRLQTDESGEAEAIILQPWEVVRVRLAAEDIRARAGTGSAGGSRRG